MSYLVTAPCVIAKDREGKNQHRYEGDVISWLSDEQAEHFISTGLVEKTSAGVGGSEPVDTEDEGEAVLFPDGVEEYAVADVPPERVSKGELVDFAKSKGADESVADGLTKPELRAELLANAADAE